MGIDGILLSDAIWIIHTIIWIRYVNHYLERTPSIEYICIYKYTHQLQRKCVVLYLNNIN
jgi:hypothetical protein